MEQEQHTKVGIGVMVFKEGKILLGKRKGSHGASQYAFPGGHLEYMESFEETAIRETLEECGIELQNIKFQFVMNLVAYAPKHYVHLGFTADWKSGQPQVLEPDKCESWDWYDLDNLPSPLFTTCEFAVRNIKTGENYFDAEASAR